MSVLSDFSSLRPSQLRARIKWIEKLIARHGADKYRGYADELPLLRAELAKR